MKPFIVFLTAVAACAQQPVDGVDLRIGMAREAALAKLAVAPHTRLQEVGDDSYLVVVQGKDGWSAVGDVVFRGGLLTRVCVYLTKPGAKGTSLIDALYSAIRSSPSGVSPTVWAETDQGPIPPIKSVHLSFPDREIVLATALGDGKDMTDVRVYYPKMLTGNAPPLAAEVKANI